MEPESSDIRDYRDLADSLSELLTRSELLGKRLVTYLRSLDGRRA